MKGDDDSKVVMRGDNDKKVEMRGDDDRKGKLRERQNNNFHYCIIYS